MTEWVTSGTWSLDELAKRRMESVFGCTKGPRVLDVGTRDGTFSLSLARMHPEMHIVGIDTDASSIAWAENKAQELGLKNVEFWVFDIVENKTPEGVLGGLLLGEFDSVVCGEVLEHLDPNVVDRAYNNIMNYVKPGGRLIVTVPSNTHISDEGHVNLWYRENLHGRVTWIREMPFLWLGWFLERPSVEPAPSAGE